jgi:fructose-bisphosphate aldolase, class I
LFEKSSVMKEYISGVILYEETLYQKDENGVEFTKILKDNGIVPGIKVDLGQHLIPNTKDLRTIGLDDLDKRCKAYYKQGI